MTQTPRTHSTIHLEGWWERNDRSIAAAAVTGLLAIGALYFNGQTILAYLMFLIIRAVSALTNDDRSADVFFMIRQFAGGFWILIVVTQFALMLLPTLALVRRGHTRQIREYLRFTAVGPLEIVLPALAAITLIPVNLFITNMFLDLLHMPEVFRELNDILLTAHSLPALIALLAVIGITPAICEEVFFRGYVQRTLERVMGWKSVVLTGVLFGLFHLQPIGLFTLSILGILFGFYFYGSRSLVPGMVAHFTNNAIVVYLYYAKPVIGGVSLGTTSQIPVGWMPASIAFSAACIAMFHVHTRARRRLEILEPPADPDATVVPDADAASNDAQVESSEENVVRDVGE